MSLFNWGNPTHYLITISYSKHGGKYYPRGPRSNSHKGTIVSNEYVQITSSCYNKETLYDDVVKAFKDEYPKASNIKIDSIIKL